MNCVCGKRRHRQFNVYWQQVQRPAYRKLSTSLSKGWWWSAFQRAYACTSNGWVHLSSELHLNTSWWNHFHTSWLKMNTSWWKPFSHTLVHASDALPVIFNPCFAFSSSKCLCVRAHTHVCTCMCVCMHVCVVIEGLTNMIMTGAEKIIVCILCGVCVCCSAYVWYFFIAVNQDYNRRARHTNWTAECMGTNLSAGDFIWCSRCIIIKRFKYCIVEMCCRLINVSYFTLCWSLMLMVWVHVSVCVCVCVCACMCTKVCLHAGVCVWKQRDYIFHKHFQSNSISLLRSDLGTFSTKHSVTAHY